MKSPGIAAVVLVCLLAGCGGRTGPVSTQSVGPRNSRPARLRVSQGVMDQSRIHYVKPAGDMQGDVTVSFWIGTDGTVEKVTALDGDPMLAQAAMEAVKQWKYTPYLLNGEPIEVETRAVVSFGK